MLSSLFVLYYLDQIVMVTVPTDLENRENSSNFVNLKNSWKFMLDLEFVA